MKKLLKHIETMLSSDKQVNFTEEDPTYTESFQYIGQMIKSNWIFIFGFVIVAIIAKSL